MTNKKPNPNIVANKLKRMLAGLDDRPRYTGTMKMPWELTKEITVRDYSKANDILSMIRARQNNQAVNYDFGPKYKRVVKKESVANGIVEIEQVEYKEVKEPEKIKTYPVGTKCTIIATSHTKATVEFPDGNVHELILGELINDPMEATLFDLCSAKDELENDHQSEIEEYQSEQELRPGWNTWNLKKKPKLT